MTARDDGATRVGGGWRRGARTGVYELADGTAKIVKMLDTEKYRWWVWSTSDIKKFRTLREAKQHIEKMRVNAAKVDKDEGVLLTGTHDDAVELAEQVLAWASIPGPHGGNPYTLKFVQTAERIVK